MEELRSSRAQAVGSAVWWQSAGVSVGSSALAWTAEASRCRDLANGARVLAEWWKAKANEAQGEVGLLAEDLEV